MGVPEAARLSCALPPAASPAAENASLAQACAPGASRPPARVCRCPGRGETPWDAAPSCDARWPGQPEWTRQGALACSSCERWRGSTGSGLLRSGARACHTRRPPALDEPPRLPRSSRWLKPGPPCRFPVPWAPHALRPAWSNAAWSRGKRWGCGMGGESSQGVLMKKDKLPGRWGGNLGGGA